MKTSRVHQSIGTELVRSVFSTYLLVTVLLTSFHLWQEYEDKQKAVQRELKNIELTFKPGLAAALWQVNLEQAQSIVDGMRQLDIVKAVHIEDQEATVVAEIEALLVPQMGSQLSSYSFDITYEKEPGMVEQIGQGRVYYDRYLVLQRMQVSLLVILLNSLIKTAVLVSAMIYFQKKIVIKPLETLRTLLEDRTRWKDLSTVPRNQFRYELAELFSSFQLMAKMLEQNFENLEDQVQEENEKFKLTQQTLMSLGTMVAGMAHDLNQPSQILHTEIAATKGSLEALELYLNSLFEGVEDNPDSRVAQNTLLSLLHQIKQSWQKISQALAQVQSIQQSVEHHIRLEDQIEFHLFHEIVDESCVVLDFKLRSYPLRRDVRSDLRIYGLRQQIGQVLTSLLSYAAEALRASGYKPRDDRPGIILRVLEREDKSDLFLEIEDDGLGMTEETRKMMMRGRFEDVRFGQGAAMSLQVCRAVVEKNKGSLTIMPPRELSGSCIRVHWCLKPMGKS